MRLIDAGKLRTELFDAGWLTDNDEHMVEEIVERQPTVDAEPVITGETSDGYITSTTCISDMANDALAYINQLEQRLASVGKTCPEWINVYDMEPGDNTLAVVLARNEENWDVSTFKIAVFYDGKFDVESPWVVTHWMPLPGIPKEE